jgi:hypothetical protein
VHYLEQHPQVYVCPVKEPHFFNTDSGHRYYFELSDYLKLFQKSTPMHLYRCEGSVWYLYSEVASARIVNFNPNARFVVMLRDPVSMYFSLHQELLFGGSEDNPSAIEAWRLQEKRAQGRSIPRGCTEPDLLQYGRVCSLGQQVERLLRVVPRSHVHFITLDELQEDPDNAYFELQRFLSLPALHLDTYSVINKRKARRSYALAKFFIWVTECKKRLRISKGFGIANAINRRNVVLDAPIDSEEIRALVPELREYFESDVVLLETQIGRNLSAWKGS